MVSLKSYSSKQHTNVNNYFSNERAFSRRGRIIEVVRIKKAFSRKEKALYTLEGRRQNDSPKYKLHK
jgi:hypothetical protein